MIVFHKKIQLTQTISCLPKTCMSQTSHSLKTPPFEDYHENDNKPKMNEGFN